MQCVSEKKEKAAMKGYCTWMDYGIQDTLKHPVKKTKEIQELHI